MARKVQQFRYNTGKDDNITLDELVDGSKFVNMSIIQLGIQAPSGVRFVLNDNIGNPGIVIDSSNMYELNVDGMTIISDIKFQRDTVSSSAIKVIIDIVYEGQEGT